MIVVFGSLNINMTMPVDNFPNPGETIQCYKDYKSLPGGKGSNQAVAAARANAKVALVGKVGDDSFGRRSTKNLKNHGIWASGIGISDHPTGCSMVVVNNEGKNIVVTAPGANLDSTADQVPDEILTSKNILLAQLETDPTETFEVLAKAKRNGAITILNPSPAENLPKASLKNIDFLIVNEVEAIQLAENFKLENKDPNFLAKAISKMGDLFCIITLEDKGAIAAKGDVLYMIPTLKVEPIDTTGAGDCFCGVFAACLQEGFDWLKAMHYASAGAALSCLGLGAQKSMPLMEDIEEKLDSLNPPNKIDS